MGKFIKNKLKRIKKDNTNSENLKNLNTNLNVTNKEVIYKKKNIKSGFESFKYIKKSYEKTIIYNSTNEEKKVNEVNEKDDIILDFNEKNTSIDVLPIKIERKVRNLEKNKSFDEFYEDFIYKEKLDDIKINKIDENFDTLIKNNNLNFSLINLFFFKCFLKNKTIAIVANSSDLLNRNLGSLIDSHDVVIRFNGYKINTPHTGCKTTIHSNIYLNKENLNEYVPIRFILSVNSKKWIEALTSLNKFKQGSVLNYNHHYSLTNTKFNGYSPPTTGFSTLISIIKLGGYDKINLFGFTFYKNQNDDIYRNDKTKDIPISKVHDYDAEKNFIINNCDFYDFETNVYTFYGNSTS